ncbi:MULTISPECIES: cellulose binding domain-containing protein [Actinomadura]|uniref:cellulose binding domain-containing protein n=1 Tax=Actinomadura TaxID=1988 RepID=UPI0003FF320E|nr:MULTISPECIES: cellulose binding domain-containing protein [Actinomadura]RSN56517.1 hypothetical protein DMH08_25205 [Actinomadura sp. WAC 06369]
MERRDGPGRAPGRHRSPEKPPPAGRGRLLTAAVVAVVLAGGSLVGWALLNESPPEPRASGCAPDCAVAAPPEPSDPSRRPSAPGEPVASDAAPSPTPSTSPTRTPTARPSATPGGDDRGRGRDGRGDRDDGRRGSRHGLRADYSTRGDWRTNFIGAVTVTNLGGRPVDAGDLVFGYGRGVRITSAWGAPSEWSGGSVVARLGVLPPGGRATVTFQAAGDASSPDHCTLAGRRC